MNLRILKKLSKRAAPLLIALGDDREQFRSERHENYHGMLIRARKHFERCPSCHTDLFGEREMVIEPRCRAGTGLPYVKLYPPHHPRKGTLMVGGVSGGEEPEWSEECAWLALREQVYWSFVDYDGEELVPTRQLRSPRDFFRAAEDLIRKRRAA
ncbi:hypothetical protein J2X65_003203 [Ancylobacter sp. 3268]|uniref:hypothetical protein n=1 Tax=Ancylobacter sp. 3268 TaxID=2817752 RepID=UPI00285EA3CB|nr:hypothetical protein [Ancylobacter sp. 3268]MDR6953840.1 hypothetical protein [Ancylobacter sp. 3268]